MKYIISKKIFPIELMDAPLAKRALEGRHGATFVYNERDPFFRVRAREFDYPAVMRELKTALELQANRRESVLASKGAQAPANAAGENSPNTTRREEASMGLFSKKNKEEKKPGASKSSASSSAGTSKSKDLKTKEAVDAPARPAGTITLKAQNRGNDPEARFAAYGKIISIIERDPRFADMPLREVSGLIGSAIVVGQYAVIQSQGGGSETAGSPVAVVLWANVSEEIDRKLTESVNERLTLTPDDWKSGDIPWLMLSAGAEKPIAVVLKALSEKLPEGKSFKARITDDQGNARIRSLSFAPRAAES